MAALPLVTVTFTTDELARCSAGLIQLRRLWAARVIHEPTEVKRAAALEIVRECTDLLNRIEGMVSQDQVKDLMQGLIQDRLNRGD
jgi:hypothetical protein